MSGSSAGQVALHPTGEAVLASCPHCRRRAQLRGVAPQRTMGLGTQRLFMCPSCERVCLASSMPQRAALGLLLGSGIFVLGVLGWMGASLFWAERAAAPGLTLALIGGLWALLSFPLWKVFSGLLQVLRPHGLRKLGQARDGVHRLEGEV